MNGESSKRGPVEEVISKRLKTLNKKIARIKSYDQTRLNADQQLAVASLPPLEAVAKELEELIKPGGPVETAELAQAGQLREFKKELIARQDEEVHFYCERYATIYHRRLGAFLRMYDSLDRPDVRYKVTPFDIVEIREMWDELKAGKRVDLDIDMLQIPPEEWSPRIGAQYRDDADTSDGYSSTPVSPLIPPSPSPPPETNVQDILKAMSFTVQDELIDKVEEASRMTTIDEEEEMPTTADEHIDQVEETPTTDSTPKMTNWADEVEEEEPIFQTPIDPSKQTSIVDETPIIPTPSRSKKSRGQARPKSVSFEESASGNDLSTRPQAKTPKSQEMRDGDGFEQVVRKQSSPRGRGRGGASPRGRGRGRGGQKGSNAGNGSSVKAGTGQKD